MPDHGCFKPVRNHGEGLYSSHVRRACKQHFIDLFPNLGIVHDKRLTGQSPHAVGKEVHL